MMKERARLNAFPPSPSRRTPRRGISGHKFNCLSRRESGQFHHAAGQLHKICDRAGGRDQARTSEAVQINQVRASIGSHEQIGRFEVSMGKALLMKGTDKVAESADNRQALPFPSSHIDNTSELFHNQNTTCPMSPSAANAPSQRFGGRYARLYQL